ncbi:hypothetical protein GN956_G17869 [Arapaima gigas]
MFIKRSWATRPTDPLLPPARLSGRFLSPGISGGPRRRSACMQPTWWRLWTGPVKAALAAPCPTGADV